MGLVKRNQLPGTASYTLDEKTRVRYSYFYFLSIVNVCVCVCVCCDFFCFRKVSDDFCLKGGLARIGGVAVVVMGTVKGHTPGDMQAANYGTSNKNEQASGVV